MSATVPPGTGFAGPWWLNSGGNAFNAHDFHIRSVLAKKTFNQLVKVLSVTGGGVGPPPVVSVQPMVGQIDGYGNITPHGPISNIPVFRSQGGAAAVIIDPAVGDIGLAAFCDRDISVVKATGEISGPGSWRQNDWADGVYIGGYLNETPTTYIQASDEIGVTVLTPGGSFTLTSNGTLTTTVPSFNVIAPEISMTGSVLITGTLTITGDVTGDGIDLKNHVHSGVQSGGDDTGPPV